MSRRNRYKDSGADRVAKKKAVEREADLMPKTYSTPRVVERKAHSMSRADGVVERETHSTPRADGVVERGIDRTATLKAEIAELELENFELLGVALRLGGFREDAIERACELYYDELERALEAFELSDKGEEELVYDSDAIIALIKRLREEHEELLEEHLIGRLKC